MQSEMLRRATGRGWIDSGAFRQVCSRAVLIRSLAVAALIGTVLNAINQGPEFLAGKPVSGLKLLFTYAVPFFVASYGAYSAFRQRGMHGH
jgi:hypothetical protein